MVSFFFWWGRRHRQRFEGALEGVSLESAKGALCGSVVDALESIADASENDIITFCKEVSRAHDRQQHTYGIRSTTGSGTTTYEAPEE